MPVACVRQTTLIEVGTSSCSGIIIDPAQGFVLTHVSVLLPLLTTKTLLMHRLRKTGRLDASHILDNFATVKVQHLFNGRAVQREGHAGTRPPVRDLATWGVGTIF